MMMTPLYQYFLNKITGVRIAAGIASTLSILGSLLIIITFCLFPHVRRTKVRQILLHISIMDLGVALANLTGSIVYFDHYYYSYSNDTITWKENVSHAVNVSCKTQAFVAMYSTYGSIFWTNWLAVFLYFTVVYHYNPSISNWVLRLGYIICYLGPLCLCVWFLCTDRLSFNPYGSAGWCTLVTVNVERNASDSSVAKNYIATTFGYDLWIYLTFILVPVLFIGTRSHISMELSGTKNLISKDKLWTAVHNVDFKFILVPITFIFLRIWTCILTVFLVYIGLPFIGKVPHSADGAIIALIGLAAVGDSGQGAANAIIFVFFTKKVRNELLCCLYCRRRSQETRDSLTRPPWERTALNTAR
ncbi:PREDICTED: probable G-protein coupled receptor 157 [Amphimedon queenslandica]|uniref:G-protein coupled receptors family 1 profile domain-containing protein n=1 Tax=Amphimedon queenslandica TaxID=400682 RepID=A0AAN0J7G8_AMPQE|nr:PREDICTED: probable G-protein coupled receptor 157 [Amphimedon queenslandica]|eukprot:XP_019852969.1 PREDICTED: probable G-protein coupled receptor 157 [Amphimedon queenslandica]